MRLEILYRTRFAYDAPVRSSHNELRAAPTSDGLQHLLHYRVTTDPVARISSYVDYWGTRVDTFGIRAPHDLLEIEAEATVVTGDPPPPAAAIRRAALDDPRFRDEHVEYLAPSARISWHGEVAAEAARRAEAVDDDIVAVVLACQRFLGTSFTYVPGETAVGNDVNDVFASRAGVCQDYAHVLIAMCRALGVPARYVSGYFFASSDDLGGVPDGDVVRVETHAWAEVALPGFGWWALDPTNQQRTGSRHVVIGRGRDYADVAPLRGVFAGEAEHHLDVEVTMRRLGDQQQQAQQ